MIYQAHAHPGADVLVPRGGFEFNFRPRHYLSESSANKTSANVEIFVSMSMCCVPDLSQWDSEPETGAFVSCNDISNPGHAARN